MHSRSTGRVLRVLSVAALTVFLLSLVPAHDAEARRGFGGGFGRSSFGKSSFGRSSFGRSSFGRRSAAFGRGTGWGRSSARRSSAALGRGNMGRRVGTKGSVFSSRSAAESAYRKNLKTRWASRPARRPDYVPKSVRVGGQNRDVVFRNGRYGYWGPGNTWVALAAGSMLMNGALLANQGYYYGATGSRGSYGGGFSLFFTFLVIFFVMNFIGTRMWRRR